MEVFLNPNVSYILLVSGIILGILALFTPGTGFIEIGTVFILLLAGYGIINLGVNAWAIIILMAGVATFYLSLRKWHRTIFLFVSVFAFIIGSIFLFYDTLGNPAINPFIVIITTTIVFFFLWWMSERSLEAFQLTPAHDLGHLIGMHGIARSDIGMEGTVYVNAEEWTATCDGTIFVGSKVCVVGRKGLVLTVKKVENQDSH